MTELSYENELVRSAKLYQNPPKSSFTIIFSRYKIPSRYIHVYIQTYINPFKSGICYGKSVVMLTYVDVNLHQASFSLK